MLDLQTAVGSLVTLLLSGGDDAVKDLIKGVAINGAGAASRVWREVFAEELASAALANQVVKNPQDEASRRQLRGVLESVLAKHPELCRQINHVGAVSAQGGGVAIGVAQDGSQIIVYNITVKDHIVEALSRCVDLPDERAQEVTLNFLNYIEKYYRYLPLKGMGDNSGLRLKFPLVELFVPLHARMTLPHGDVLPESLRVAGRQMSDEERAHIGGRLDEAKPILTLIREQSVLVILGDPGSGKSTVVRLLAYLLATGQGEPLGLPDYLPLLLPLASYSERLAKQPDLTLRRFALDYFHNHLHVDDLRQLLDDKLKAGKVLILLDGLDEVKEVSQRSVVVDRVQRFLIEHIEQGNRVVMTSRIIGYKEVRPPEIEGLRECTLLDFESDEIKVFIERWTATVERQACDDAVIARERAEREAAALWEAIQHNDAVRGLASNPLLLTMLVIQKRQGVTLPHHRVLLYEQYMNSLLRDWLLERDPRDCPADLPNDRALRKVLEPLAYWLQQSVPGKGVVNEAELLAWLRDYYAASPDADAAADQFIKDVREHSGLLIDRGGKRFGFLHLTFMEYLAGASLANRFQCKGGQGSQEIIERIAKYALVAEWRETLLLAIGYLGLKQRFDIGVSDILERLLKQPCHEKGAHHELTAAALADMGKEGVTDEAWHALRHQLVTEGLRGEGLPARRRVVIGESLAAMGDPRPYPWGDDADAERMNFDGNIGSVSPLGAYPLGASPYGCEEMSGNVLEWTRSLLADYPYPEALDERQKREGAGQGRRVLRGGAFYSSQRSVRCAYRDNYGPGGRGLDFGFRVVLSPYR